MTLEQAIMERDRSRKVMNNYKHGTKKWRKAEDNLNYWQGKIAMLEIMERKGL